MSREVFPVDTELTELGVEGVLGSADEYNEFVTHARGVGDAFSDITYAWAKGRAKHLVETIDRPDLFGELPASVHPKIAVYTEPAIPDEQNELQMGADSSTVSNEEDASKKRNL